MVHGCILQLALLDDGSCANQHQSNIPLMDGVVMSELLLVVAVVLNCWCHVALGIPANLHLVTGLG
jgi:hypothetical protein